LNYADVSYHELRPLKHTYYPVVLLVSYFLSIAFIDLYDSAEAKSGNRGAGFHGVKIGLGAGDPGSKQRIRTDPDHSDESLVFFGLEVRVFIFFEVEARKVFREVGVGELLEYVFFVH
jgi:hypothetical protein